MSLLASAEDTVRAADAPQYETVRDAVADPSRPTVSYAVERRVTDGALMLAITTERKDADPRVKRVPLAPVARAMALGVLD